MVENQKHVRFDRRGDKLEVIIRDPSWNVIYKKEINTHDNKEIKMLLKDLRDKGVDIIGLIKQDMMSGGDGMDWFE